MSRVLVSYSHDDKGIVDRICDDLRDKGLLVWRDTDDIPVGASIARSISNAVHESDYVLIVLSQSSVSSNWVAQEVNMAIHEAVTANKKLLPVLIEDCEIPVVIADRSYADFRLDYSEGLKALLRTLNAEAGVSTHRASTPNHFSVEVFSFLEEGMDSWVDALSVSDGFIAQCVGVKNEEARLHIFRFMDKDAELSNISNIPLPVHDATPEGIIRTSSGRLVSVISKYTDDEERQYWIADLAGKSASFNAIGILPCGVLGSPESLLEGDESIESFAGWFIGDDTIQTDGRFMGTRSIGLSNFEGELNRGLALRLPRDGDANPHRRIIIKESNWCFKGSYRNDGSLCMVAWYEGHGQEGYYKGRTTLRCTLVDITRRMRVWSDDCIVSTHPSTACPASIMRVPDGWVIAFTEDHGFNVSFRVARFTLDM